MANMSCQIEILGACNFISIEGKKDKFRLFRKFLTLEVCYNVINIGIIGCEGKREGGTKSYYLKKIIYIWIYMNIYMDYM